MSGDTGLREHNTLLRNHQPQEPTISQECKEAKSPSSLGSYSPSPIDHEIKMSRQTPSLTFMLLRNPPLQSSFSLQPFSSAPSSGLWSNRSVLPPSASRLRQEAQKIRLMCPPPCNTPFLAPFTLPRFWISRQPAYSLLLLQALVAPYGPGCLPVCSRMLSLHHLQVSTLPTWWKVGSPTDYLLSMFPCWS